MRGPFEALTPEQWASATWCGGWTVRDVAGHLIVFTGSCPSVFFSGLAKAGFSFNKMVDAAAKHIGASDPASLSRRDAVRRAQTEPPARL